MDPEMEALDMEIKIKEQELAVLKMKRELAQKKIQTQKGKEKIFEPTKSKKIVSDPSKEKLLKDAQKSLIGAQHTSSGIQARKNQMCENTEEEKSTGAQKRKRVDPFASQYKGHTTLFREQALKERKVQESEVSFAEATAQPSSRKVVFVKIPSRFTVKEPVEKPKPTLEVHLGFADWKAYYNLALTAGHESVEKFFYTTDEKDKSTFNFIEGADPELVYKTFCCGLVNNIYPSSNLMELRFFPESFKNAIKFFRIKVLKSQDRPLVLRCTSSYLDWDKDNKELFPYHLIKIGLAGIDRTVKEPEPLEPKDWEQEEVHEERAWSLSRVHLALRRINSGSQLKVNYATNNVIIVSHKAHPITPEDAKKVGTFEVPFNSNQIRISEQTRQLFCPLAQQIAGKDHICPLCVGKKESSSDVKPRGEM